MDNAALKVESLSDPIPRVLREFYFDEALMAVSGDLLGEGKARLLFQFPIYTRSRGEMGHVSSMQISGAILEGGFCALADALSCGYFPDSATPEWFYSTLNDWLALRMNVLFRRAVKVGEPVELNFRILDIGIQRLRRRKLSATIEFDGFCSGETMWVIDPPAGMSL